MASEIRVNQIQNRSGLTTTTFTDTGVTISGILTVSENLNVGGVVTYEDVTNVDAIGIVTARAGINLVGNDLNVGSNIKIGNASGIVTATTFVGNLTGTASANAVLTGSTNNQLVTVTGANAITGEANLTFDGNDLTVTGTAPAINFIDTDADDYKIHNVQGLLKVTDTTASADRLVINDNGTGYFLSNFQIGSTTTSPGATLHVKTSYPSLKVDSGGHASDAYVRIIAGNAQNSRVDFGDSDDDNIGIIDYDHNGNYMSFTTNASERLRITSDGKFGFNTNNPLSQVEMHGASIDLNLVDTDSYSAGSNGPAVSFQGNDSGGSRKTFADIHGLSNGSNAGDFRIRTRTGGNLYERMRITAEGDIYGPVGGRKNWFDNGSFDCTYGGRKANTSMDYGNHHAYGWVTDRFQSRNSVQWSRSTNVPAGKGFSYSTQTNGAGGTLVQAVELPDYGDMGVFAPNSYWCVSVWSTASLNQGGQAFSYDLGSTKTGIPIVHPSSGGAYQTTGETASGTSSGTFSRYYMVFQMPSSIISTATSAYWTWGFTAAGYHTGFQLERVPTATSKPTPYEHVHPSVTIARCRRYCYRKYNSRHVCGWKRHDSGISWDARHPVLPTHMPSGSNQSVDPYGVHMHTAGTLTNFQSVWQNPGVSSLSRYGFNPADGSFILNGQSGYSGTHLVIPSYEGFEYEISHGHF